MLLRLTSADSIQEDEPILWETDTSTIVYKDRTVPNTPTKIILGNGLITIRVTESVDEIEKLLRAPTK